MGELNLHSGETVLFDDEDAHLVIGRRWYANRRKNTIYAIGHMRRPEGGFDYHMMHRLVMGFPDGLLVDHINGDGLDNRKSNLRIATRRQNNANHRGSGSSSRFRGVSRAKWVATGNVDGAPFKIGYYDTEEEAALAYDVWALEAYGEFAWLNFPAPDRPQKVY